jgi:hypothetical protein
MWLRSVRYGLPLALVLLGVAFYVIEPNSTGFDGLCAGTGAGLSLLLLNLLFRAGVEGDKERDAEEAARSFYDEHGRWPDEPAPPRPPAPEPPPREPRLPRAADGGALVRPGEGATGDARRAGARLKRSAPTRRRSP